LWRAAAPAGCATLILSDVVGNPLPAIGSGPTVPTDETARDALDVLHRYGIDRELPEATWQAVVRQLEQSGAEPPPAAPPPHNLIVGDVARAARAARRAAAGLGFAAEVVTTTLGGEARDAGLRAARRALDTPAGHCLIWAGETTVTVRGDGRGGRNQETALAAVEVLDRAGTGAAAPRVALVSFATDGEDRIAGVAGAVVTDRTAAAAREMGEDPEPYLENNDSYAFFRALEAAGDERAGGLLTMPPTGTNVNDLLAIFTYDP
jgi:hydroxypyruvate reductase